MFQSLKKRMVSNRLKKSDDVDIPKEEDSNEKDYEQAATVLPDDLLLMIFNKLSTEERVPLGTTCKRFRELDFELGKKTFDSIFVNWQKHCHHFTGRVGHIDYNIFGGKIDNKTYPPLQPTRHNLRFLRNAKATTLYLAFACKLDKSEAALISSILRSVTFKKLSVFFEAVNDYDIDVVPNLFKGRDLEQSKITLCWKNSVHHDGKRARNLLMQLPKVDQLQIEFEYSANKIKRYLCDKFRLFNEFATAEGEFVLDDESLLHITANTNRAVIVGKGKCSAQGILKAFEIVRHSPLNKKLVFFFAPRTAVDELTSTPNLGFETFDWNHDLFDPSNRSLLAFSEKSGAFYTVSMGKVDENGRMISWNRSE